MGRYAPGQCQSCGEYTSGLICRDCIFVEKARGRAWAEGAAEVLRPLIERLTPVYNVTVSEQTAEDGMRMRAALEAATRVYGPPTQPYAETLEKKP